MEPMVIDIIIAQESNAEVAAGVFTEKIIERWTVQYELRRLMTAHSGDAISYKKTYKKLIILLRSVFAMLKLLPGYKAFRKLSSLKQITCGFDIRYKVCSFGTLFSRTEEESMKKFTFFPVDGPQGCLCVSVVYQEDLSDFKLDSSLSCPPEIITEYVGSPLADPRRAFTCFSSGRGSGGRRYSFSHRRPHSWTSGLHEDAQGLVFSGSPPLSHSLSPSEVYSFINHHESHLDHHTAESDAFVSPPCWKSSVGNPSESHINLETAPIRIPFPLLFNKSQRYLSPNFSDPNHRHSLPPLSPRNTRVDTSSNESPSGIRAIRRLHSLRAGELSSGSSNAGPKVYPDAREDSSRLPSSSSSPRIGLSRSSRRLSFQEDMGDYDLCCPFIVDDVDPPDSLLTSFGSNNSQVSSQVKKSQDAVAVGTLVRMLKAASPLRQKSSYRASDSSNVQHDRGASDYFKPHTISEALEELRAYKEIKQALLSKSAYHLPGKWKSMP